MVQIIALLFAQDVPIAWFFQIIGVRGRSRVATGASFGFTSRSQMRFSLCHFCTVFTIGKRGFWFSWADTLRPLLARNFSNLMLDY